MRVFLDIYLKIFFVLTPFFVISVFLAMTRDLDERKKRRLALRVSGAVMVVVLILFFFGQYIFSVFGVTLDAFKVGAGVLLFLSAISLVQGTPPTQRRDDDGDIAVVPLAIPVTVGPATTGVLLVMAAEMDAIPVKMQAGAAILCAVLTVSIILYLAGSIERHLGQARLTILSKLTGLMLASIAAQMIFTGIRHFLR